MDLETVPTAIFNTRLNMEKPEDVSSSDDNMFEGVVKKDGWKGLTNAILAKSEKSDSRISWPMALARIRENNPDKYVSKTQKKDYLEARLESLKTTEAA